VKGNYMVGRILSRLTLKLWGVKGNLIWHIGLIGIVKMGSMINLFKSGRFEAGMKGIEGCFMLAPTLALAMVELGLDEDEGPKEMEVGLESYVPTPLDGEGGFNLE
jgi:hypothetical protein